MTETRRGRRSAEVADRTRTEILDAALELFADQGYDAVSLREIAQAAGTTHGLIRHHFGTKEQVWQAVVELADVNYRAVGMPAIEVARDTDDPREALAVLVKAVLRATAAHPEFARLLLGEGMRGGPRLRQIVAGLAPLRQALGPIVRRLKVDGSLQGFDVEELLLFVVLAGVGRLALGGLAGELTGRTTMSQRAADRHAERIVALLV